ncbi:M56 family metallopeptidase [Pontixanthobacter aestiaquae]|uniref:Peptidase M56 domain-containing protein n=1 Tax=Pontixanthobacter aestiaquae TaxID=1509367 RepID=A0A844Z534_9SPHN|nr:M56 family metallopeptidase [Pontixanthobacter aestiaquae]MDN3645227.1 M56 family metallopeptidase [Pontixanthobacter aestiaquae]MXO83771.1 hypothetical protein [Pontixanthobacter aestiaquae]
MTTWLFDTLVWTAALIALVLVIRRPVARYLGPKFAYALWAIPLLRLILPPLTLPAWLAPAPETVGEAGLTVIVTEGVVGAPENAGVVTASTPIDWALIASVVWLLGAAAFLAIRFTNYFRMRAELLEDAYPVGEAQGVRLVETPATNSPIAFGVFDKVVALPEGFMVMSDKTERDLALEHELSHHKAHDLFANFAAQPLFALHWFNPLAWYGWRAMRRDQEAACDARVIAARGSEERAAYANVIASFATGPNAAPKLALAAPMACPVIGEKSIIHRLRSLTMSDISPRRKLAGRALIGAAILALPLTASISYAESMTTPNLPPAAATAPKAPMLSSGVAVPAPPAPPAAPFALQAAPEAPDAPEAAESETRVYVIENEREGEDGKKYKKVSKHSVVVKNGEKLSEEERDAMMKELREELAEVDVEIREAMEEVRVATIEMDQNGTRTKIKTTCKNGKSGETVSSDGTRTVHVCTSEVMAQALTGIKEARKAIANDPDMAPDMRAEVLRALDEKIENWGKDG